MDQNKEIGRELKANDLKVKTVIVVKPPNRPYLTMWVTSVTPDVVELTSGVMNWTVVNFVQADGTLHDDQGRQVHVFEYLGEI